METNNFKAGSSSLVLLAYMEWFLLFMTAFMTLRLDIVV